MYKQVNIQKDNTENIISIPYWIGMIILANIPILNIILLSILSFTATTPTKKNFFRAWLVVAIPFTALYLYELAKALNLIA
ncbi:MAG: hypothetical protein J6U05_06040 [Neisseriaceae bacterium]|nr:hypothetical protein [Neisseriaceae bacterium]